ncbi:MAG: DoxX family protein [Saccharospirillaceae bacterium]|nr:DoxX family protein [Pseudomonadales bacterium]NRB78316.1 DoxX family protein [Saccharospirillaceae bacterium]
MNKFKKYGLYASLGLVTFAFTAAGLAKLAGVEQMHVSFAAMGLPVWFGYFIGASELAGAIGIWVKKVSVLAVAGLMIVMSGAIYFHLVYEVLANAIPAFVLSILLLNILFNRLTERKTK